MANARTQQGTVQSFDSQRGVGEIRTESGEVFAVHRSALRDDALSGIFPGDIVEFVAGRNRFGRRAALEVRRVGWEDDGGEDDSPREWTF
jgi:cold shock CspA family protein